MEDLVRKTTFDVVKNAEDVHIKKERINKLADKWVRHGINLPPWPKKMHLETTDERTMLDYLIILDSLNFCFWSKKKKWKVSYKGKKYEGYFALSLALKKFFEAYPGKANLAYFSNISYTDFKNMLDGRGKLLLLEDRWVILRKVSLRLLNEYNGDSRIFINSSNKSIKKLIYKIAAELYSFNDIAYFKKKKVYFLKRAQILTADIIGAFDGKSFGKFKDPEYLTAFADYKIPQLLNHWKILEYSDQLMNKIKKKRRIIEGSREEIEIRSASIYAVEYLKEALAKKRKKFNSYEIDWLLWKKSQNIKMRNPHHLTETIFY